MSFFSRELFIAASIKMRAPLQKIFALVIFMAVSSIAMMEPSHRHHSHHQRHVRKPTTTQNVIVSFKDRIESVIDKINKMKFPNIGAKRTALTKAQIEFSNKNQKEVQDFLRGKRVKHQTIWINNKMYVAAADDALVKEISKFKTVAKVDKENVTVVKSYFGGHDQGNSSVRSVRQPTTITWGIKKIRANDLWNHYTGRGVVVAGIDSGVLHTHEALSANWRHDYGWFDPIGATPTPNDQTGHGAHTMGTLAGNNGCGVAPQATWIACKGCSTSPANPAATVCYDGALMMCGQWVQCPTPPNGNPAQMDCTKAPRIVSNSWGNDFGGNQYYDTIIASWNAVGIMPVFAIGNDGQKGCGSVRSPGDRNGALAVGDMTEQNRISPTSSLGPAPGSNLFKPDVAAPGTNVISAWHTGNNQYSAQSGTSYACPHVSGVIALMVQKNPGLTNAQIYDAIIRRGVLTTQIDTSNTPACGGVPATTYPNHVFGYGRIDAVNCVNAV